jgi:hypothetical protein
MTSPCRRSFQSKMASNKDTTKASNRTRAGALDAFYPDQIVIDAASGHQAQSLLPFCPTDMKLHSVTRLWADKTVSV